MPLRAKPIDAVTKADVVAFADARRAVYAEARTMLARIEAMEGEAAQANPADREKLLREARVLRTNLRARPRDKGGEVGVNRHLARLRHLFSWAIDEGYVECTPFKRGDKTVVRLDSEAETPRERRLAPGDEEKLLRHANPHLRSLIVAGLSTGCRVGELLSLQWHQVKRDAKGEPRWLGICLPAKRRRTRNAQFIGARLRAELEMRRTDPAGEDHEPEHYVFGNEVGEQVLRIDTAWRATCRRAGIVGLHFHDLRREFGSQLMESAASLHDVRDFLGHANITTTSRYLNSSPVRLEGALAAGAGENYSHTIRTRGQFWG